jgi:hypothetical protein
MGDKWRRCATSFLMLVVVLLLIPHLAAAANAADEISLAGEWRFALDPSDVGEKEQWFARDLPDRIQLPGVLQAQGFGDPPSSATKWTAGIGQALLKEPKYAPYQTPGHFKLPFWLTPERTYVGAAWYQRDIEIPESWDTHAFSVFLERPHWETTVWVDDQRGKSNSSTSLGTPHVHLFTSRAVMAPGKHRLTIRVDNRVKIPVGNDAHSVSDQTQGNWNGIAGELKLQRRSAVYPDAIRLFPDVRNFTVHFDFQLRSDEINIADVGAMDMVLEVSANAINSPKPYQGPTERFPIRRERENADKQYFLKYGLGVYTPWNEFSPTVYRMKLDLKTLDGKSIDTRYINFGMRELSNFGTQFMLNGQMIFLRGTLDCCIYPKTGHPPMDVESWKRVLTAARAHGLNHIRFHSWCPPEAAFQVADEMGFYFQVECSCWAAFGDGSPADKWLYEESERMVREYGNHPSFILMAASNEPGGKNRDRFLGEWVKHWTKKDSRRHYTAGSGWPMIPENNYNVTPAPRIQATNKLSHPPRSSDYGEFVSKQRVPVISHEIGQWCVYPDFTEIPKYTGYLKPGNLEIFRDFLEKSGMANQARDFVRASGKFQALLYKDEIETALRTSYMAGFQLLDLHDFPGQGTAPVGVLNAFWEEKGYIKPEEYRRFCNSTVPLARMNKLVFTNDETFTATVDVANFGPSDPAHVKPVWRIRDASGQEVASGVLEVRDLPEGGPVTVGAIALPLAKFAQATKLNLEVALEGTPFANDWNFWVFPAKIETAAPESIHVAKVLDDAEYDVLSKGGKVLLLPPPGRLAGNTLASFRPIFWNRVTFPSQKEHTVGILCDPKHPALRGFPTDFHSDWQWWDLQENGKPMVLDGLPREFRPVVQLIDDWNVCRKLGLVLEARVGEGRLVVCSIDLERDLATRPVARQMRRSLLDYMASDEFKPAAQLTAGQIATLFREPSQMEALGAKIVRADSAAPGYGAANLLDGDPNTIWHTAYEGDVPEFPHEVVIGFDRAATIRGLRLTPRQDMRNGWFREYAVFMSEDGKSWGDPVARGSLKPAAEVQEIDFARPATGKFLKLVAASSFAGAPFASLAELEIK